MTKEKKDTDAHLHHSTKTHHARQAAISEELRIKIAEARGMVRTTLLENRDLLEKHVQVRAQMIKLKETAAQQKVQLAEAEATLAKEQERRRDCNQTQRMERADFQKKVDAAKRKLDSTEYQLRLLTASEEKAREECKKTKRESNDLAAKLAKQAKEHDVLQEDLQYQARRAQDGETRVSQLHEKTSALQDETNELRSQLEAARQLAEDEEQTRLQQIRALEEEQTLTAMVVQSAAAEDPSLIDLQDAKAKGMVIATMLENRLLQEKHVNLKAELQVTKEKEKQQRIELAETNAKLRQEEEKHKESNQIHRTKHANMQRELDVAKRKLEASESRGQMSSVINDTSREEAKKARKANEAAAQQFAAEQEQARLQQARAHEEDLQRLKNQSCSHGLHRFIVSKPKPDNEEAKARHQGSSTKFDDAGSSHRAEIVGCRGVTTFVFAADIEEPLKSQCSDLFGEGWPRQLLQNLANISNGMV